MDSKPTETETISKTITDHLPCVLSAEERATFGRMAAHAVKELATLEDAKKLAMADLNAEIKSQKKTVGKLAEVTDTGVEWRQVDCRKTVNRYLGRVTVTRLDTGEVIEDRPMTHDEAQTRMEMD